MPAAQSFWVDYTHVLNALLRPYRHNQEHYRIVVQNPVSRGVLVQSATTVSTWELP